MSGLTIIITMAGLGSRFRKAGYNVPKYMIEAKGRTLFEWSMDSLADFKQYATKFIFIVQRADNAEEFIKSKCNGCGIDEPVIVQLDGLTNGQATTCMKAMSYCESECPILIYNIDTYVEPNAMKYSDLSGDGCIPCFNALGDHWSFVALDSKGCVIEVREKERISDNCSIGAYYFKSAALFEETYSAYYSNSSNVSKGECYIAPMYNYLLDTGK